MSLFFKSNSQDNTAHAELPWLPRCLNNTFCGLPQKMQLLQSGNRFGAWEGTSNMLHAHN